MNKTLEFIKTSNDSMFKAVFCKERNRDLLEKLIEEVLKRKIKIKDILMQDIPKENIKIKDRTLDIIASADKETINIELNIGTYDGLNNRNACYIFDKYSSSVKPGEDYKNMNNFIQINLTSGLSKSSEIYYEYKLIDLKSKKTFIENLTIYEFNLDKIKEKCYNEGEEEYKILATLMCDKDELHSICKGDKLLEKLESEVIRMNEDAQVRENIIAMENAQKVHNTLMVNAKEEGYAEGFSEGKLEIAKNMLNKNIDINTISEITGLTKEEIEKLK